jgi:hypothetical protein
MDHLVSVYTKAERGGLDIAFSSPVTQSFLLLVYLIKILE